MDVANFPTDFKKGDILILGLKLTWSWAGNKSWTTKITDAPTYSTASSVTRAVTFVVDPDDTQSFSIFYPGTSSMVIANGLLDKLNAHGNLIRYTMYGFTGAAATASSSTQVTVSNATSHIGYAIRIRPN